MLLSCHEELMVVWPNSETICPAEVGYTHVKWETAVDENLELKLVLFAKI